MRALTVKLMLAAVVLASLWTTRCGAQVTLAWTASTDPTVTGYYLVWGQISGDYTSSNTYPSTQTSATVTGLTANQVYYFNLAAFNSSGLTSGYAGEVSCTNGSTTTSTSPGSSLTVFGASTNGPPSPSGSGLQAITTSGNGGSSSINSSSSVGSGTGAVTAARFWGVPPFVVMSLSNGQPNLNIAGTVGATLMVQATTNVFSADSWETMTNIAMTNVAPIAQSNQQAQTQDALDLAFVPAAEALPMTTSNSTSLEYFRAVMPYDYVILAGNVLTGQGYKPRLIVVNMPGVMWDDACYVTEGSSFIHYDKGNYALQLEGSGPTIRSIASTLATSLKLDWTSASEFTYSNGVGQILATVVQTEPPSADPVAGQVSHKAAAVIDF